MGHDVVAGEVEVVGMVHGDADAVGVRHALDALHDAPRRRLRRPLLEFALQPEWRHVGRHSDFGCPVSGVVVQSSCASQGLDDLDETVHQGTTGRGEAGPAAGQRRGTGIHQALQEFQALGGRPQ